VAAAQALAERASVVLANAITFATSEATNRHLQLALENARLIGRAQGVLMAREGCGSEKAFDILRRASQRTNRKLREIAEEIVAPFEPSSIDAP
jgi:AmiR/NasT family two-component response regulator